MTQGIRGSPFEPTSLTDDVRRSLIESSRLGRKLTDACKCAGIDESTVRSWRAKARAGEASEDLVAFLREMKKATQQGIECRLQAIQAAGMEKDWRALAWLLERQYPDEFARRTVVAVSATEDPTDFASGIREAIRGMDFYTRRAGRLAVTDEAATNGGGKVGAIKT